MTVKELIEFLQIMPQDIEIAYCCMSEQVLIKKDEIMIIEACKPRNDGWLQNKRPDMPTQKYLLFPGN